MAIGITNAKQGSVELPSGTPVCFFRCTVNSSAKRANLTGFAQSDYFSYDSDSGVFTAKKAFTGTLVVFGRGARNSNGNAQAVTYRFHKDGSQLYTGTIGVGGDSPSDQTISFTVGSTASLYGTAGGSDMPMIGFAVVV